jgi:hypothetical protein
MKSLLVVIIAAFAAAFTWPAQASGYQYQIIDYPGAPQTEIFGINNKGMAVGDGFGFTNVAAIPFQYDSRKKLFTVVPAASGYTETDLLGINDSGVMVGTVSSLDGSTSAFIRNKDGTFSVFRQPGWANSQGRGINDAGLVCGFSSSADGDSLVGFIYDPRGNTFTSVLPSPLTIVSGINNRGQIAGSVYLLGNGAYPGSPEGLYAFVRNADGRVTIFRVNGQPSRARGISDSGEITGFLNDASTTYKGFVTTLQGSSAYQAVSIPDAKLLANPLGGITYAQGVANNGAVSGTAVDTTGLWHGFVATP